MLFQIFGIQNPKLSNTIKAMVIPFLIQNRDMQNDNLCIADRYAVITEDANIYSVLSDVLNIECLAVEKGNVLLPGYPVWFYWRRMRSCGRYFGVYW